MEVSALAKETDKSEELETDVEEDETPYVEYDISVNPSDQSLELLSNMIEREDIIIPFYQRKYVWNIEQASKLIESFLIGLPVPQVFLYINEDDQLEVIDGQQRLMSVHYFFTGFFGEIDTKGKRTVFKLKGLSERSDYNEKTYDQLTTRDQRKLRNSTLRAINIKQLRPEGKSDAVFHIFERLNTGGTLLKPQEIRNAVYRGNIVESLQKLNALPAWQAILGLRQPDKNQKDVELVLRLFSLFEVWEHYEKPMLRYLNQSMDANRNFDTERAHRFETEFVRAACLVAETLKEPFRPKRVINAAVLEAVMVTLLEHDIGTDALKRNYPKLIADADFEERIYGATTDQIVLKARISRAKEILLNGTN